MIKLLVVAVIIAVLGVTVNRFNASSTAPTNPVGAQQQVDKARQNINDAVDLENQRSTDLSNVEQP